MKRRPPDDGQEKARWQAGSFWSEKLMSDIVAASAIKNNPAYTIPLSKQRGSAHIRVSPEIAQHWLTFNTANRALVAARVQEYTTMMQAGKWADNGENIKFSYGKLLDGQTRLSAVVAAGVTIRLPVEFGMDPEVQVTIDTGRNRTPRDILSMEGLSKFDAATIGSALHNVIAYKTGGFPHTQHKYNNDEIRNFFLEHRSTLEKTMRLINELVCRPTPLPYSRAVTMHYIFAEKDRALADWFFSRLYLGDELKTTSPVYHLRHRLTDENQRKIRRPGFVEAAYLIKTWNAIRRSASWRSPGPLKVNPSDDLGIV